MSNFLTRNYTLVSLTCVELLSEMVQSANSWNFANSIKTNLNVLLKIILEEVSTSMAMARATTAADSSTITNTRRPDMPLEAIIRNHQQTLHITCCTFYRLSVE